VLHGLPASSGRVRGTARLIREPRQAARLKRGDILVTRATDPGWTPVFPLVSGLVTEVGGQLSHMAIIAREYGVPAVVNVRDAMRQIPDGTTITVDGTAGEVHLIQDKEGG
jgi:pyruvate,water dikinase